MNRKPLFEANVNASSIAASVSNTLAVTVTHNAGGPFTIESFCISYDGSSGQESVTCELQDTQSNRKLIVGNMTLGTIGHDRTSARPALFRQLKDPIVIASGQSVQLYLSTPSGVTISAQDITLALQGFQE